MQAGKQTNNKCVDVDVAIRGNSESPTATASVLSSLECRIDMSEAE